MGFIKRARTAGFTSRANVEADLNKILKNSKKINNLATYAVEKLSLPKGMSTEKAVEILTKRKMIVNGKKTTIFEDAINANKASIISSTGFFSKTVAGILENNQDFMNHIKKSLQIAKNADEGKIEKREIGDYSEKIGEKLNDLEAILRDNNVQKANEFKNAINEMKKEVEQSKQLFDSERIDLNEFGEIIKRMREKSEAIEKLKKTDIHEIPDRLQVSNFVRKTREAVNMLYSLYQKGLGIQSRYAITPLIDDENLANENVTLVNDEIARINKLGAGSIAIGEFNVNKMKEELNWVQRIIASFKTYNNISEFYPYITASLQNIRKWQNLADYYARKTNNIKYNEIEESLEKMAQSVAKIGSAYGAKLEDVQIFTDVIPLTKQINVGSQNYDLPGGVYAIKERVERAIAKNAMKKEHIEKIQDEDVAESFLKIIEKSNYDENAQKIIEKLDYNKSALSKLQNAASKISDWERMNSIKKERLENIVKNLAKIDDNIFKKFESKIWELLNVINEDLIDAVFDRMGEINDPKALNAFIEIIKEQKNNPDNQKEFIKEKNDNVYVVAEKLKDKKDAILNIKKYFEIAKGIGYTDEYNFAEILSNFASVNNGKLNENQVLKIASILKQDLEIPLRMGIAYEGELALSFIEDNFKDINKFSKKIKEKGLNPIVYGAVAYSLAKQKLLKNAGKIDTEEKFDDLVIYPEDGATILKKIDKKDVGEINKIIKNIDKQKLMQEMYEKMDEMTPLELASFTKWMPEGEMKTFFEEVNRAGGNKEAMVNVIKNNCKKNVGEIVKDIKNFSPMEYFITYSKLSNKKIDTIEKELKIVLERDQFYVYCDKISEFWEINKKAMQKIVKKIYGWNIPSEIKREDFAKWMKNKIREDVPLLFKDEPIEKHKYFAQLISGWKIRDDNFDQINDWIEIASKLEPNEIKTALDILEKNEISKDRVDYWEIKTNKDEIIKKGDISPDFIPMYKVERIGIEEVKNKDATIEFIKKVVPILKLLPISVESGGVSDYQKFISEIKVMLNSEEKIEAMKKMIPIQLKSIELSKKAEIDVDEAISIYKEYIDAEDEVKATLGEESLNKLDEIFFEPMIEKLISQDGLGDKVAQKDNNLPIPTKNLLNTREIKLPENMDMKAASFIEDNDIAGDYNGLNKNEYSLLSDVFEYMLIEPSESNIWSKLINTKINKSLKVIGENMSKILFFKTIKSVDWEEAAKNELKKLIYNDEFIKKLDKKEVMEATLKIVGAGYDAFKVFNKFANAQKDFGEKNVQEIGDLLSRIYDASHGGKNDVDINSLYESINVHLVNLNTEDDSGNITLLKEVIDEEIKKYNSNLTLPDWEKVNLSIPDKDLHVKEEVEFTDCKKNALQLIDQITNNIIKNLLTENIAKNPQLSIYLTKGGLGEFLKRMCSGNEEISDEISKVIYSGQYTGQKIWNSTIRNGLGLIFDTSDLKEIIKKMEILFFPSMHNWTGWECGYISIFNFFEKLVGPINFGSMFGQKYSEVAKMSGEDAAELLIQTYWKIVSNDALEEEEKEGYIDIFMSSFGKEVDTKDTIKSIIYEDNNIKNTALNDLIDYLKTKDTERWLNQNAIQNILQIKYPNQEIETNTTIDEAINTTKYPMYLISDQNTYVILEKIVEDEKEYLIVSDPHEVQAKWNKDHYETELMGTNIKGVLLNPLNDQIQFEQAGAVVKVKLEDIKNVQGAIVGLKKE